MPAPPSGDLAHNLGISPDWESIQGPFVSQACCQSTEPHQPGLTSHTCAVESGHPDAQDRLRLSVSPVPGSVPGACSVKYSLSEFIQAGRLREDFHQEFYLKKLK